MSPTPDMSRWLWAGGASLLFLAICALRLRPRRRTGVPACDVLVVHASQTGRAEDIARRTHARLVAGGIDARLASLKDMDPAQARTILAVASTTGDGDAPDEARAFEARAFAGHPDLSRQGFAVLALGDRAYAGFCAFGLRLDAWLKACGARPLAPCFTADDLDPDTLEHWDALVSELGGGAAAAEAPAPLWTLATRERLNPQGTAPLYRLTFTPPEPQDWAAGDLVELVTRDGHRRDYSIASLAREGHVELYVREVAHGAGSGLLIHGLDIGGRIGLRLKSHNGFHMPVGDGPLLLIGAGSGLAGLRAHILQARGRRPWVVYGERHPQHDRALVRPLEAWRQDGTIDRLSLGFSQPDDGFGRYVQDALAADGPRLRDHLGRDGAVMVCGGLAMGRAVDTTLRALMGDTWIEQALSSGRYRRDLY